MEELEQGFRICPICGKKFYLPPQNIYKLYVNGKLENYCSYTCYRTVQKKREKSRKYKSRDYVKD